MPRDTVDVVIQQWAEEQPELDASALGIVVRIQLLGKHLGRRTNRALKSHGLKHWEYDVLAALRRQGAPFELAATDIARAVHLTSGAMTTRIDGLEQRKLVSRRQSKKDGRSVLVKLTSQGRKEIDLALATRLDDANAAMSHISAGERRQLANNLSRLLADLEQ